MEGDFELEYYLEDLDPGQFEGGISFFQSTKFFIIVGCVGFVVFILLLVLLILCCMKCKQKRLEQQLKKTTPIIVERVD